MTTSTKPGARTGERGKAGKMLLLWLVGIPLPIILVIWLVTGC